MTLTLQRYIFKQLIAYTLVFIVGIGALALLIDFTEFSNRTSGLPQYSAMSALLVSAMRVPTIIVGAIPFIMLFATVATLITLNRKYELVIARASGVSAWVFLQPTWIGALFVGILVTFLVNPLATEGFSRATEIEGAWRGSAQQNTLLSQDAPWLRQSQVDGDGSWIINAQRSANRRGRTRLINPTFVEISEDGAIVRRIDARVADLVDAHWVLVDAKITQIGEAAETRRRMRIPTELDPTIIAEALLPPTMVSIYALPRQIATAQSFGVAAYPFRMQFHSLIALPALLVAMSMISATVSLRFVRFGQSGSMILGGILCGFVLYVLAEMTKSFGGAGLIHPLIAAWIPVFVAGMFSMTYLLYREDG